MNGNNKDEPVFGEEKKMPFENHHRRARASPHALSFAFSLGRNAICIPTSTFKSTVMSRERCVRKTKKLVVFFFYELIAGELKKRSATLNHSFNHLTALLR